MSLKILVNSLSGGGAELQAVQLARDLKAELFILDKSFSARTSSVADFKILEGKPSFLPSKAGLLFIKRYAKELAAKVNKNDIVLSFMPKSNFVNAAASELSGHKAVLGEITQPSREYSGIRGKIMQPLIKKYYRKAALIIANSKGNALDLKKNFDINPEKIKVIYNSCDISAIRNAANAPLPKEYEKVFEKTVIITAGRLTKAKGQWHLLKIFSEIKKELPEAKLIILGDGNLKRKLRTLAAKLGLNAHDGRKMPNAEKDDVFFAGFQKNPFCFLRKAKIFIFPSLWEGLPNAVIEALAAGIPVMAADCASGPREILAPETDFSMRTEKPEEHTAGMLLPPFNAKADDFYMPVSDLEKTWAAEAVKLLKDEKTLIASKVAGMLRATDFDSGKQILLWKNELSKLTR